MLAVGLAAFFLFGAVLVSVGATQAEVATGLGLDLEASGLLGAFLSIGLGVGVAVTGPLIDRYPRRPLFVMGLSASAAGLAAASFADSRLEIFAALAVAGFGCGSFETLVAAAVSQAAGERATRALAQIHATVTVGAFVGAPALAALIPLGGWPAPYRALSLGLALVAIAGAFAKFPSPPPRATPEARRLSPALIPLALIAASYVGVEVALTVFAQPYAQSVGLAPGRGVMAISTFWIGLLAGRLALVAWPGVRPGATLVAVGGATALVLGLGASLELRSLEIWWCAVGALLGCVFPLASALTVERFPESRGTALGIVLAAGAAGGFLVPWWTGRVGDAVGVQAAIASLAAFALLIAAGGAAASKLR